MFEIKGANREVSEGGKADLYPRSVFFVREPVRVYRLYYTSKDYYT